MAKDLDKEIEQALDNIHVRGCDGNLIVDKKEKHAVIKAMLTEREMTVGDWEDLDIAERGEANYFYQKDNCSTADRSR